MNLALPIALLASLLWAILLVFQPAVSQRHEAVSAGVFVTLLLSWLAVSYLMWAGSTPSSHSRYYVNGLEVTAAMESPLLVVPTVAIVLGALSTFPMALLLLIGKNIPAMLSRSEARDLTSPGISGANRSLAAIIVGFIAFMPVMAASESLLAAAVVFLAFGVAGAVFGVGSIAATTKNSLKPWIRAVVSTALSAFYLFIAVVLTWGALTGH